MPNLIDIILRAQNLASAEIEKVRAELEALGVSSLGLTSAMVGLGAVMVLAAAASVKMAASIADEGEQLERLSIRTGVATGSLQIMQEAIREGGGDVGSLTTSLTFLNRSIENQSELMAKLGISTRDPMQALLQLGKAFAGSTDSAWKNSVAIKVLGRGGAELIADLESMATSWDTVADASRAAGLVWDPELIAAAKKMDAQMDISDRNFRGAWSRMRASALPIGTAIVQAINDIVDAASRLKLPDVLVPGLTMMSAHGYDLGLMSAHGPEKRSKTQRRHLTDDENEAIEKQIKLYRMLDSIGAAKMPDMIPGLPGGTVKASGPAEPIETRMSNIHAVLGAWGAVSQEIMSGAALIDTAVGSLAQNMAANFRQMLEGLSADTHVFQSLMVGVFNAIKSAVMDLISQIIKAAVIKGLIRLIGLAIPGASPFVEVALGVAGSSGGGSRAVAGANTTTNITIQAIDSRSINDSFRSASGAFSVLNRRTAAAQGF